MKKPQPVRGFVGDAMGQTQIWNHGRGKKPGTLAIGTKLKPHREVHADSVRFMYGPDAKKFGIPYEDPYADLMAKYNESSLKKIASSLLKEAEEEEKKEEGEDSVDAQIDKYLSQYESQAKEDAATKTESVSYGRMTRDWRRLLEADEEKEEPAKPTLDDFNMKSFVSDVVRLIENYDSLLEIRNTILRRAVNHLTENYDGEVLASFKEELLESHGMEIGKTESERDDEIEAPKAGAAGPMAGGGAA